MLLNKHNLKVREFCLKEQSRYTLSAILVEKDATVATDTHRLIKVSLPSQIDEKFPQVEGFEPMGAVTDEFKPFMLAADTAGNLEKDLPKSSTIPILQHVSVGQVINGKVKLATVADLENPRVTSATIPDGRFPDYEAVLPTDDPKETVTLNPEYLLSVAKFAADFTKGERGITVKIELRGKDRPVIFRAQKEQGQKMMAVLMPMRDWRD